VGASPFLRRARVTLITAGLLLSPGGRHATAVSSSSDWDRLARGILSETNEVRRDPEGYARLLEQLLPRFEGALLDRPGRRALRTEEGARAVREAVRVLRDTRAMGGLTWSKGMAAGARDHVRDQGPTGGMEHRGRDGSSPAQRVTRYGRWHVGVAENIAFGENPAREVVIQLLVDDGVPDRGHRKTILDRSFGVAGVACGPHAEYEQMCVIDYAVRFSER